MALVRSLFKTNDYAVMVGANVNNGTTSSVLLPFCTSFISSQGITRLSNTSISVSESGLYEIKFPLSYSSASGLTFFVEFGVNGTYSQISTSPSVSASGGYASGYYSYIANLNFGDVVTLRCRLSSASANFITNMSLTIFGGSSTNTVVPTSSIKRL